ncbi:MAG: multicopper oxidase domain-containing protein, partial [Mobilicoccus sp.]|nr:multicopper oxidase domain-containing protein [Mobilicoccus sp.]
METRPPRTWWWRHAPTFAWLLISVGFTLVHPFVERGMWLIVHGLLLGALGHAILVWSSHFTQALLRSPEHLDPRHRQAERLIAFHVGVALVLTGVAIGWPMLTVPGALLIGVAVAWHLMALVRRLRRALPGRFTGSVHYYVVAATMLPAGLVFGALMSLPNPAGHTGLLVAHVAFNVLGWMGLTVVGTLVTFWPTLLRARIDERAQTRATQALPALVVGVLLIATGGLIGMPQPVTVGLVTYLAGLAWWATTLVAPWRARTPREFAPWSVAAALVWLVVGLVWVTVLAATEAGRSSLAVSRNPQLAIIVAGFAAQLLIGALSYLLPAIGGGGPAVVRAAAAPLERWATARIVLVNAGLLLCLLPLPSTARVVVSLVAWLAWSAFLPLAWASHRAARRTRALAVADRPAPEPAAHRPGWSAAQCVGSLAVLALALTTTLAAASTSTGPAMTSLAATTPTGETTRVRVEMTADMRFVPDTVEVPAGNRLVIDLVNTDTTTVHDLVLDTGARSVRVAPGTEAEFDAGVIEGDVQGWCDIIGHRQAGMVFSITTGASGAPDAASAHHAGAAPSAGAAADIDLSRAPADDFVAHDATLPPLPPADGPVTHEMTIRMTEIEQEVAPGIRQTMWTFNDTVPGPTLHGRVGDTFEITLINDGTMGHSIDFHAGDVAPDVPMRTIPPGEQLVYTFTARRAGIWMYHCGTAPVTAHIAAGMAGAVVIEPDDLPAVDRSYVITQAELYLGEQGEPLDVAKAFGEQPDLVVFNGYADQYVHRPLEASVGETVRFWVLDIGPNRPTSFHVIGGQFDTVYHEGAYLLRDGRDALGGSSGGSQAIGLQAAQGGFVEMTPTEAGRYPFVSHIMVDAERGAKGI